MMRCSETVFGERVQHWQCTRRGIVERDGKWYCRQHDPMAVSARQQASYERYQQQVEKRLAPFKELERLRTELTVLRAVVQQTYNILNMWLRGGQPSQLDGSFLSALMTLQDTLSAALTTEQPK